MDYNIYIAELLRKMSNCYFYHDHQHVLFCFSFFWVMLDFFCDFLKFFIVPLHILYFLLPFKKIVEST